MSCPTIRQALIVPLALLLVVCGPACRCDEAPTNEAATGSQASAETAVPGQPPAPATELDAALASKLVKLSLECVDRPYPYKPGHVLHSDEDLRPPRELTPAFFGCFDWHSAVHGHWTMVRLLKTVPTLPEAPTIRERLSAHLTEEIVETELALFKEERSKLFERPYGWGWLLRLAAELHTFEDPQAGVWASALESLDTFLASRTIDYLNRLTVPVRAGTHQNTAFSMTHMLDYARIVEDGKLEAAIVKRSREFYLGDRRCPTAYEPSGEDFISPCLAEADLMRRVLDQKQFVRWLGDFLPRLDSAEFAPLREPVAIKDLEDPRIGHLIGLAFQRAWCFEGVASALPVGDARVAAFRDLAVKHRARGLKQMFDSGYGGEHWLASFAVYLLSGAGPY